MKSPSVLKLYDWSLRNPRTVWMLVAVVVLSMLCLASMDREPPLKFLEQSSIPIAHAGEEVTFEMKVSRNLLRACSVSVQRSLVDESGAIRDYGREQDISAAGREMRDKMSPGLLRLTILVPPTFPSGKGKLMSEARWQCPRNPTTYIFPIQQAYSWDFEVLPPDPPKAPIVIVSPPPNSLLTSPIMLKGEMLK